MRGRVHEPLTDSPPGRPLSEPHHRVVRPERAEPPVEDASVRTVVATLPRPEAVAPAAPSRPAPPLRVPAAPSALAPTGELVAALWDSDETTPIDGWIVSDFAPDRGARWPRLTALAIVLIAIAGAGTWWILTAQDRTNADALEAVSGDVSVLIAAAADTDLVAADLANAVIDDPLAATRALSTLNGAARALFDDASALSGDEHRATRLRAVDAAQQALAVEAGLGDAVAYEAAIHLLLERPALPTAASGEELPVVAADLAAWVSRVVDGASGLPAHPLLEAHRADVDAFADGLATRQVDYLDRLRAGDEDGATTEAAGILAALDTLAAGWETTAERVADWSRGELATLATALDGLTPAG